MQKQLRFEGERVTWIQASTLGELLDIKAQHPDAKLVVGNTEIGKAAWGPLGIAGLLWSLYSLPECPLCSLHIASLTAH